MKKILFDNQMFTFQRFGGVTRYFADLIYNLPSAEFEASLPMSFCENHYVTETYGGKYSSFSFPRSYRLRRRLYQPVNRFCAWRALSKGDYDIFHPTYFSPYFLGALEKNNKPFVLTVHDMVFERYPQDVLIYDRTIQHKKLLVEKAAHIIAVSENTKRDVVEILGTSPDKISVVHHGYRAVGSVAEQLFDNYVLYVGERKGYKNFFPWLSAVRPLLMKYPTLRIVCTGTPFGSSEVELFAKWNISDRLAHNSQRCTNGVAIPPRAMFCVPVALRGLWYSHSRGLLQRLPCVLEQCQLFPRGGRRCRHLLQPARCTVYGRCLAGTHILAGPARRFASAWPVALKRVFA